MSCAISSFDIDPPHFLLSSSVLSVLHFLSSYSQVPPTPLPVITIAAKQLQVQSEKPTSSFFPPFIPAVAYHRQDSITKLSISNSCIHKHSKRKVASNNFYFSCENEGPWKLRKCLQTSIIKTARICNNYFA